MSYRLIVWGVTKGVRENRAEAEELAVALSETTLEPVVIVAEDKDRTIIVGEVYLGKVERFDDTEDEDDDDEIEDDEGSGYDDEVSEVGYNPYTGGYDMDL